MLGLKIFVRVQTFWRRPFVPSHNFCHPGSHLCLGESIYEWLEARLWSYFLCFRQTYSTIYLCAKNMLFLNERGEMTYGSDLGTENSNWKFKSFVKQKSDSKGKTWSATIKGRRVIYHIYHVIDFSSISWFHNNTNWKM